MSTPLALLLTVILLAGNAFFVGAEFAVTSSSWLRREEVTANSAPTKKALPARRMTVTTRARGVLIGAPPQLLGGPRGWLRGPWDARGGG